ncbi:MAG: phosphoribosylformylglycinamidine synthase [Firmicutes bacterium]|nr:phosphoribosylformylglycinamidine synthase [Bacillota bacterium]
MNSKVRRIFVEKKKGFDIEAQALYKDLKYNLGIKSLEYVRIINRYDVEGISEEEYEASRNTIFSEPPVDIIYDEVFTLKENEKAFAVEYLPGQYDQRADSAAQCIQIMTRGERPLCRTAKLIVISGDVSQQEFDRIKNYCINPIEAREASFEKPESLDIDIEPPADVETLEGFTMMAKEELLRLIEDRGFAMSLDDMEFCQNYFKNTEKRDPTITELRMLDTYWSDHCRHTTFLTRIENVEIKDGKYTGPIKTAFENYMKSRQLVYKAMEQDKDICLMDIATIAMKEIKMKGLLNDLDESEEINACSIVVNVDVDGKDEEWVVMFKNETHNHPTEIEPFGGAATCLGGAIRDPLSGRAYVYQAMRVTGSGDPRAPVEKTLPGKLPQRKITIGAAQGFSSYGNQVGLATGQVVEMYDEGYVAKRMEIGAVIGAAPRQNVVRGKPLPGDVVILLGGRTGRDGCGGATGSSKEHDEQSLLKCGAEVQKGNPPTERKIQRLFRNPSVSRLIKKCNDFGAGGVLVAIGELADGLEINLDAIPKKYEGLDGTELAISESQERMAVVVSPENVNQFISEAALENLEATPVAYVTEVPRVRIRWRGKLIVDISREFLNTNGVKKKSNAVIVAPDEAKNFFSMLPDEVSMYKDDIKSAWLNNLGRLNVCSQKGLVERFDSTIGAGTVLMPFGGKCQLSPSEGMVAKIPLLEGDTSTGTIMTFGYNPVLSKWSPFHGAVYAIIEAISKVCAIGGDYRRIRLTLQEYFEKLGKVPEKWGKPLSALLGAYYTQIRLGIPSIGGKDSMSGTFKDMDVPPTLVAFAVDVADVNCIVSTEFKEVGSKVVILPLNRDNNELPDFEQLDRNYTRIHSLIKEGKVLASSTVKAGGIAETISKMCFGNMIGFTFENIGDLGQLFVPEYGSIILEIPGNEDSDALLDGLEYRLLGHTNRKAEIIINGVVISLKEALHSWEKPLEEIFPTKIGTEEKIGAEKFKDNSNLEIKSDGINCKEINEVRINNDTEWFANQCLSRNTGLNKITSRIRVAKPRVFMPVFPGTNCEYDTTRAFEKAGGLVDIMVIRNITSKDIEESIEMMAKKISNSQIIMLPGGFSGGDEPDGSGKFIATAFRNPYIKEAVMDLLKERDGLILGICNGFQALIKLGLVPYGEIRDMTEDSPTLTFNTIGRHVSRMVYTKVVSTLSPWLAKVKPGDVHTIAVSHGEGRFIASPEQVSDMFKKGQVATQYVDFDGKPSYDIRFNPNGSVMAIEGITSPDGRVFGKMGHSERIGSNVAKNVPGEKDQKLFEAGVEYFL